MDKKHAEIDSVNRSSRIFARCHAGLLLHECTVECGDAVEPRVPKSDGKGHAHVIADDVDDGSAVLEAGTEVELHPKNKILPLLTLAMSESNITPPNWANINGEKTNAVATSGETNAAGLFDMTGNVLEFCWDWYGFYSDSTTFSPDVKIGGPEYGKLRTSRGGSWNLYTPFYFAGDRYAFDPSEAYNYLGFRRKF